MRTRASENATAQRNRLARPQIVKFSSLFPEEAHVYWYSLHTFGGGLLLGIAIYGWAGWTA